MEISAERRENLLIILTLFAACFVCYGNVLTADFVWDDTFLIAENPLVRAPILSFQAFKQDIYNSSFSLSMYYRPVQILSYAVDKRLWGFSGTGFHFTSIFIHFLNTLLAFFLAKKLTGKSAVSFASSLFFAVSPAQVFAVSYVSGRADLLFFFFSFLSALSFLYFRDKKERSALWLGSAFFALALLSKEMAVAVPFLILLMDYLAVKRDKKFSPAAHIPNFTILGAYVLFRLAVLKSGAALLQSPGDLLANSAIFLRSLGWFFLKGIFPAGINLRLATADIPAYSLIFTFFLAVLLVLSAVAKKNRLYLFSIAFYVVSLVPIVAVASSFGVVTIHWAYLAGFGLYLFVSLVLLGAAGVNKIFYAVIFALFTLYSAVTVMQNISWQDESSLTRSVLAASPSDDAAARFKAVKTMSGNDMSLYLETNKNDARAWCVRGRIELVNGELEKAEKDLLKALEIDPAYDIAYESLALVKMKKGERDKGIAYLEKAVSINPRFTNALVLLTTAYFDSGRPEDAVKTALAAKKIDPYDYDVIMNLGTSYTRIGKTREGALEYLEAIKFYPEQPLPYYNLAYLFYLSGDLEKAVEYLNSALLRDPAFRPALELLHKIHSE